MVRVNAMFLLETFRNSTSLRAFDLSLPSTRKKVKFACTQHYRVFKKISCL
jgi:hypothetical protein